MTGPDAGPDTGPGTGPGTGFVARMAAVFGPAGAEWARGLPALLGTAAKTWELRLGEPWPPTYGWVCPARRADGTPAVLKAAFPGNPDFPPSVAMLRLAAGCGYPRLLAADEAAGLLLLEALQPGVPLTGRVAADDAAATRILAGVLAAARLPVPAEHAFPTLQDWARGFARHRARYAGGAGPLPARLFDHGERRYAELLDSQDLLAVLHGDLHHDNVLSDGIGWRPIDPQGVVGEPAHETAAMLRNPAGWEPTRGALERRVSMLAEVTGFDAERIRAWGVAQSVLSAVWSLDEDVVDHRTLRVAALLAGVDLP